MGRFALDHEYLLERQSCVRPPEAELFFGVILQAFEDLRETIWRRAAIAVEAREWLLQDELDFPAVCHLALVDPTYIRNIARRYIAHLDAGGQPKRIVLRGSTQGDPPWPGSPHRK